MATTEAPREVARALRDAGMEVIDNGLRQTPEMNVHAALQKEVRVIDLSILFGARVATVRRVSGLLRENQMEDVAVIGGRFARTSTATS